MNATPLHEALRVVRRLLIGVVAAAALAGCGSEAVDESESSDADHPAKAEGRAGDAQPVPSANAGTSDPFTRAAEALVLVSARDAESEETVVGEVFARDRRRAFVLITGRRDWERDWERLKRLSFSLDWGWGDKSREVSLDPVAFYPEWPPDRYNSEWVLAGPAQDMPGPVQVDQKVALAKGMKVRARGYTFRASESPGSSRVVAPPVPLAPLRPLETGPGPASAGPAGTESHPRPTTPDADRQREIEPSRILRTFPRGEYIQTEVEGTIDDILPDIDGGPDRLQIAGEEMQRLHMALVLATDQGIPIGLFRTGYVPYRSGPTPLAEYRVLDTVRWTEPATMYVTLAPRTGDHRRVEFELVAYVNDPLGQVRSPRLLIWPTDRKLTLPTGEDHDGPWERLPGEAIELSLVCKEPSKESLAAWHRVSRRFVHVPTWVARHEIPNPAIGRKAGEEVHVTFDAQVAYEDPQGKIVYGQPRRAGFKFDRDSYFGNSPWSKHRPDIPGLDGKILEGAWPIKLEDGSYRITGPETRVPPHELKSPAPTSFPQPEPGGETRIRTDQVGDWDRLKVSWLRSEACRPMLYSQDGKWLYLIDRKNAVHKIDAHSLQHAASLRVEDECVSLHPCEGGLLLVKGKPRILWVLDADSLEVIHEISGQNTPTVATSPNSPIAFADAGESLLMIDVARGRIIHRLRAEYGQGTYRTRRRVSVEGHDLPLGGQYAHSRMTNDGKRFYRYCQPRFHPLSEGSYRRDGRPEPGLWRFRIEGQDLIFEKWHPPVSGRQQRQTFALCGDGRLAACGWFDNQVAKVCVFDPMNPDPGKFTVDGWPPVAFDGTTGNIYIANPERIEPGRLPGRPGHGDPREVLLYNSAGKKIASVTLEADETDFLAHPEGGQFVVTYRYGFTCYRRRK